MSQGEEMENKESKKFKVDFFDFSQDILGLLLEDRSSKKNLLWATNNYRKHGKGFLEKDQITFDKLKRKDTIIIQPRIFKTLAQQKKRSKDMAEVFTPSWVCNKQNNLVDDEWFGYVGAFNKEKDKEWKSTKKVTFKNNKNWQEYVSDTRMEITCGEAPYLTSRYDTVSGEFIKVKDRIGLLDRKLRVISENTEDEKEWFKYAKIAIQNIYGFDFQGDNVFIARVNLLSAIGEYHKDKFKKEMHPKELKEFADIIVWNVFQMDGLKFVIPLTCHKEKPSQMFLPGFEEEKQHQVLCEGCAKGDNKRHNGTYVRVKDWEKDKTMRFLDLGRGKL